MAGGLEGDESGEGRRLTPGVAERVLGGRWVSFTAITWSKDSPSIPGAPPVLLAERVDQSDPSE
jgi:hypothetical protein